MKTIKELNEKIYYRLFKSTYVVLTVLILIIGLYNSGGIINDMIGFTFITSIIFFEIIRRAIFYTVLGTVFPKK